MVYEKDNRNSRLVTTVYQCENILSHKLEKDIINFKALYFSYGIFSYQLVVILNCWHILLVIILISNLVVKAIALPLKNNYLVG